MLLSTSATQHVVFDGANESLSFLDFVQRLEQTPDLVELDSTTSSVSKDIEYVIPTHLYGEALRYYESLDRDCQEDWTRLLDVMAGRFPGAMRSGGANCASVYYRMGRGRSNNVGGHATSYVVEAGSSDS
ncbi:glycoside hydrolase family 88 protein [Tulasnella calospora MUT 4182]|uniref:Glycoside hydrolase family 88 protein n=1 Tax=Tulasnella calospora MUT 4182 TaxID=1051891 RepID=A0A0C3PU24_9AGAM|nr:glycoside hydrolase family 88 protein [Tulasnella calospora MUT 4182]